MPVGKETVITVDAAQAGVGKVTCRIRSPNGADIDIDIIDRGDGTFSIAFTPQMSGPYTIEIKFGGELIPDGNYVTQVSEPMVSVVRGSELHRVMCPAIRCIGWVWGNPVQEISIFNLIVMTQCKN